MGPTSDGVSKCLTHVRYGHASQTKVSMLLNLYVIENL